MSNLKPLLVLGLAAVVSLNAQTKKIVVLGQSPATIRELQSASDQVRIVQATQDTLMKEIVDADAIFGTISPALIKAGKNLKWVQTYSAGVELYRSDELLSSSIVLTNAKIIQGPNIADHAMALLLSLTRHMDHAVLGRANQQWAPKTFSDVVELNGKTGLVIGVGGIGTQIAVRASAFGMRIIGVDPKEIPYIPALTKVVPPDRLDSVIPEADVVFVSAPDSPGSRGMFGQRQFDLMKKGSYFIAVSRGKVFNHLALAQALESGKLKGAGLDATDPEPLPRDHPLWKFPNIIITPHIAAVSDNVQTRRVALLKENIRRFVNGERLINQVDKDKGY